MATKSYLPLYIDDYLADTAYLSTIAHGAYLLLIFNYWQTGKELPNDDRKLARIARMSDEEWLNVRLDIRGHFVDKGETLFHKRVDEELKKAEIAREKWASQKREQRSRKSPDKQHESPDQAEMSARTSGGQTQDVHGLSTQSPLSMSMSMSNKERDNTNTTEPHKKSRQPREKKAPTPTAPVVRDKTALSIPDDPDKALYQSIQKAFLSKNGDQFTNWPKEAQGTKGIIEKCKARNPADPSDLARAMIRKFWELKSSNDKFFSSQPFTPSVLNSSGIWDRVLEQYRDKTEQKEKAKSLISDFYAEALA